MKNAAIIVAGGLGHRMKSNLPKQFMLLGGKPVVQWSLECFNAVKSVEKIVLVLPNDWIEEGKKYIASFKPEKDFVIATGGELRQDSVRKGLVAVGEGFDYIAVHDAARPGITPELAEKGFEMAREKGNAIFAVPSYDTLAVVKERIIIDNADRNIIYRVQTPQIFDYNILMKALYMAKKDNIVGTDEATLVRRLGEQVYIIIGNEKMSKITTSEDLEVAEFLLNKRKQQ
ncbi:MAG: 2-C-methyl-D-erythritol 4-phosphate cytidylyltransferase [Candidatus Riflebacteria bacterium]|nr:2-C-methyl-D-erythritol 4-phosphate cytidylyltransferase [Candidatus Riflebacteria bacterium]